VAAAMAAVLKYSKYSFENPFLDLAIKLCAGANNES
jgi:hypothetical protein